MQSESNSTQPVLPKLVVMEKLEHSVKGKVTAKAQLKDSLMERAKPVKAVKETPEVALG